MEPSGGSLLASNQTLSLFSANTSNPNPLRIHRIVLPFDPSQLFKSIDVDNSGELDEDDFIKLMSDDVEAVAATWRQLAVKFDADGDDTVTM